ncbi:hypothetical protein T12_4033 [Trichinella patagoniensis]|uniref:Uncharacterized protein n=1 Tax=Trichinella patagoniensis TaxID=990121 RepID=A0A0V0Z4Y4_9BILA|nr:hypothetical protein T12_4033 [Trichinella patagoniensis]
MEMRIDGNLSVHQRTSRKTITLVNRSKRNTGKIKDKIRLQTRKIFREQAGKSEKNFDANKNQQLPVLILTQWTIYHLLTFPSY